jgi:hypothetical protein
MNNNKLEETHLEALDKALVGFLVLKDSTTSSDNREVKVASHLEMFLKSLKSSLVEANAANRNSNRPLKREKTSCFK